MQNSVSNEEKSWFALYTKPRSEFKAAQQIGSLFVEFYLPAITKVKQWSDRKKKITEPLITGYIFIYSTEKERLQCLECDSVVRCVFDAGKPAIIPNWQIENLKKMLELNTEFTVYNGLIPGSRIVIKDGPFAGITGIIQEIDSVRNFVVSIDLLNRSVIAHLSKESVIEKLKE